MDRSGLNEMLHECDSDDWTTGRRTRTHNRWTDKTRQAKREILDSYSYTVTQFSLLGTAIADGGIRRVCGLMNRLLRCVSPPQWGIINAAHGSSALANDFSCSASERAVARSYC